MTQTCPVAACFPWRLPGAEPLRPKKTWALELRGLPGALTSPLCVLHESVWRGGRGQVWGRMYCFHSWGLPGLARDPLGHGYSCGRQ